MALVTRKNRPYYYRTERCGGRTRRYYVGGGMVARFAGESDSLLKQREEARRDGAQRVRQALQALNRTAKLLGKRAELLARATLILEGWRIFKRSEWRRRAKTQNQTRL